MNVITKQTVSFQSLGDRISGEFFLPETAFAAPALVICHGAGEYKENYFALSEFLLEKGIASLVIDMHGHGSSEGERSHVNIQEWVADIRAAIDFLSHHSRIDSDRIGAFGLSSGGTAILEAAVVEPRLKAVIALDATVRNSLPVSMSLFLKGLTLAGRIKKLFTGSDLRVPLAKFGKMHLASDPEVDQRLQNDERGLEAFMAFPFPGGAPAFFVDTIVRVPLVKQPTLVIWGEDDKIDPVSTAHILYNALSAPKRLEIIAGNGHMGHLDRHHDRVFALTAEWLHEHLA